MPHTLDQILPSLESLGVLSYWIVGLAAMLEAWFLTGLFVPGTLAVDAGGMLVQQGVLDFLDLAWFVAIGSALGAEIGYWTGRLARRGLRGRPRLQQSAAFQRAEQLFVRRGGMALVIGRFLGPISGLVPLAAALSGMERRRFVIWNIAASLPYALAHVALGYFLGDVLTRMSPAITRLTLVATGFALGLALVWWVVIRLDRLMPFAVSVGRSVVRAIAENPDVANWAKAHPKLSHSLARRLDSSRFGGLTATFLALVFVYILFVWAGSVFDFLTTAPIMQADIRVANLMHTLWTPELLRLFTWVTAFGSWQVVTPLMIAALIWLLISGRDGLALGLTASVAGNLASATILKAVFDRPRPELAYFAETSHSFPSGHAAISVAFWGMLFYALWRSGRLGLISATFAASGVAFTIGFSRIFLIEHYATDVMNGWLVGGLWLVIGIALTEWRADLAAQRPLLITRPSLRRSILALAWAMVPLAGWNVVTFHKLLNQPPVIASGTRVSDVDAMLKHASWESTTESVMGTPLEPVNLIILAGSEDKLLEAMRAAGWKQARPPSPGPLMQAAWAAWTNGPDDTAPVTPYFWAGQPNDLAFEKPTAGDTLRERHHVRIWRSPYLLADGRQVFLGAASFDDGLDPGIFHHIDPNIDAERDTLAADLAAIGAVLLPSKAVSPPRLGTSVAGDPWFTDGKATLIELN